MDMGMTYLELSRYGRLRRPGRCGPFSMFTKLVAEWSDRCTPREVRTSVASCVAMLHASLLLLPSSTRVICARRQHTHEIRQYKKLNIYNTNMLFNVHLQVPPVHLVQKSCNMHAAISMPSTIDVQCTRTYIRPYLCVVLL